MISDLKSFRMFILLEYILGLYRPFFTFGYFAKTLIISRIIWEFLFIIIYVFNTRLILTRDIYVLLNNAYSFSLPVLSCYTSRSFLMFIDCINTGHVAFKNDETYSRNIKWCFKISASLVIGYFVAYIASITAFIRINLHSMLNGSLIRDGLVVYSKVMNNCRLHFEHAFYYCIIYTISEQLRCIISSVQKADCLVSLFKQELIDNDDCIDVEKWRQAYMSIKKSLNIFNTFAGIQIAMSLGIELGYCITIFYSVVSLGVKGDYRLYGAISLAMGTTMSLLIVGFVARAAHRMESNTDTLVRCLRRRLIQLHHDDCSHRAIRDFIRVIATHPMSMTALGASLNMTSLPTCFSLVTTTTVTMLQFNNVI